MRKLNERTCTDKMLFAKNGDSWKKWVCLWGWFPEGDLKRWYELGLDILSIMKKSSVCDDGYVNMSQNGGLFYYAHLFIYNIAFHLNFLWEYQLAPHTCKFQREVADAWITLLWRDDLAHAHMRFTAAMPRLHPCCFCHLTHSTPLLL